MLFTAVCVPLTNQHLLLSAQNLSHSVMPCRCTHHVADTGLSTRDIVSILKKLLEGFRPVDEQTVRRNAPIAVMRGAEGRASWPLLAGRPRGMACQEKGQR